MLLPIQIKRLPRDPVGFVPLFKNPAGAHGRLPRWSPGFQPLSIQSGGIGVPHVMASQECAQAMVERCLQEHAELSCVGLVRAMRLDQLLSYLSNGPMVMPMSLGKKVRRLLLDIQILPKIVYCDRSDSELAFLGDSEYQRFSLVNAAHPKQVQMLAEYLRSVRAG